MSKKDRDTDRDTELIKNYLGQYQRAKRREKQLEHRLQEICEEMNTPIGGISYSPVNTHPTNEIGPGAASFVFRKSEQESRIEEQRKVAAADLLKIMDVMDYLDRNSEERAVLELHYIDGISWPDIADEMEMARSTVFERQRAGLEELLSFKRIRKILTEYARDKGL